MWGYASGGQLRSRCGQQGTDKCAFDWCLYTTDVQGDHLAKNYMFEHYIDWLRNVRENVYDRRYRRPSSMNPNY